MIDFAWPNVQKSDDDEADDDAAADDLFVSLQYVHLITNNYPEKKNTDQPDQDKTKITKSKNRKE